MDGENGESSAGRMELKFGSPNSMLNDFVSIFHSACSETTDFLEFYSIFSLSMRRNSDTATSGPKSAITIVLSDFHFI